jgi:hypothetical protein
MSMSCIFSASLRYRYVSIDSRFCLWPDLSLSATVCIASQLRLVGRCYTRLCCRQRDLEEYPPLVQWSPLLLIQVHSTRGLCIWYACLDSRRYTVLSFSAITGGTQEAHRIFSLACALETNKILQCALSVYPRNSQKQTKRHFRAMVKHLVVGRCKQASKMSEESISHRSIKLT